MIGRGNQVTFICISWYNYATVHESVNVCVLSWTNTNEFTNIQTEPGVQIMSRQHNYRIMFKIL